MRRNNLKQNKKRTSKGQHTVGPLKFALGVASDSYGAVTPCHYSIPSGQAFFDANYSLSVTTTPQQSSILTPLLGAGGIMPSFPQIATPVFSGSSVDFYQEVRLREMWMSVCATGAQSNIITSGDLFNTIRLVVFKTGIPYSINPINPLPTETHRWPNPVDILEVVEDLKYDLPTVAFDSNINYNVPNVRTFRARYPLNTTLQLYTQSDTGTTGWDTKDGNLLIAYFSDSSASPHPNLYVSIRVFYDVIRR